MGDKLIIQYFALESLLLTIINLPKFYLILSSSFVFIYFSLFINSIYIVFANRALFEQSKDRKFELIENDRSR